MAAAAVALAMQLEMGSTMASHALGSQPGMERSLGSERGKSSARVQKARAARVNRAVSAG
jgi:hypothetical protein